jgi:uncharacterized protein YkwD
VTARAAASVVTLLLIALLSPALPPGTSTRAEPTTAFVATARAMTMARHAAREPLDGEFAADLAVPVDVVAFAQPLARAGDAASRLAVIAPTPTPVPTRRPAAAVAAPQQMVTALQPMVTDGSAEVRMLALINASRVAGGLVPLAMDERASDAARAHSAVESRYGYVYHDGPDGTAGSRNVPACGNGWYGENTGKIWHDNVTALHVEFMSEPWAPINHRTNIMDPAFRRVGIGAVQGRDALYMTTVFCR